MDRPTDKPLPLWLQRRVKYGYADENEIKRYLSRSTETQNGTKTFICPKKCQHCGPMIRCPKTSH